MTSLHLITRANCANTERAFSNGRSQCLQAAPNICKGCFLVQYCGKECQKAHWSVHKSDCKSPLIKATWKPSWEVEKRQPAFVGGDEGPLLDQVSHGRQKYLWGNVPALDLVKLQQHEGADFAGDLRLLFAASGDIRNVVKSLVGLPETYAGHCQVVVNDKDPDIVARNAILLLIALHFSPETAASMMLHLWYSALIPAEMLRCLQDNILPLIQEVCNKIQAKPAYSLLSKTWTYGTRTLRLVLTKEQWDDLLPYFEVPDGLSATQAQVIRASTTLAPERKDYLERALLTQPPTWRVCTMKFRKDGILLPFGASRQELDSPNPTFYQNTTSWPMLDSADPLEGWPIDEIVEKSPPAKNDIYGSLFFYLQDLLGLFCHRIGRLKVSIRLFQVDARKLPSILEREGMKQCSFDRIEVSNIADRSYLGPEITLATFGPLLKRKPEDPHATIVALFLNAIHEVCSQNDYLKPKRSDMERLVSYIPMTQDMVQDSSRPNADAVRLLSAQLLFRDFDDLFNRFISECRLDEISQAAQLTMKSENTIVHPWPLRLRKNATQREFELRFASGHTGSERYVEWKSAGLKPWAKR